MKNEFWKLFYNSVIVAVFIYCVYWAYKWIPKEKYLYEDSSMKVKEIKRFEVEQDTMIIMLVNYKEKDYLITKSK